jgi:peroxiredoxin Q/BCP
VDKPEANLKFARRLELPFPILSDPGKQVARAYGVLKIGLFASRKTIVIDREGRVAHIETKVTPTTAGADLVSLLTTLGA